MKKLLTALACLGIALLSQAQQNNHPGYIVRSTGDTVHGYLREVLVTDLVNRVGFKSRVTDNEFTEYTPDQVTAFQYDSTNIYRALTFTTPLRSNAAPQTTFARLLVAGEFELYRLYDENPYFLAKKDTILRFLYDDDIHAVPYVKGNFRNELNFFAVGCEFLRRGIEGMSYTEDNMIRYFQNLDACLNPNQRTTVYKQTLKARLGFFAYTGGGFYGKDANEFTGEARMRLTYPKLSKGLSFNIGFRYVDASRVVGYNSAVFSKPTVTYKQTSIPLTFQYNLTNGIFQPFIAAGFSMIHTTTSYSGISAYYYDNYIYPDYVSDDYMNKWSLALLGAIGVEVPLTGFLQARLEWRFEEWLQVPTIGISVRF